MENTTIQDLERASAQLQAMISTLGEIKIELSEKLSHKHATVIAANCVQCNIDLKEFRESIASIVCSIGNENYSNDLNRKTAL